MSFTVNDALLSVAYRMGYNSVPSEANEKARWIFQCDDAQRAVIRKNYYWFTQDTKSLTSVDGQQRYELDSTFRAMIDVRINNLKIHPITQHENAVSFNANYTGVPLAPSSSSFSNAYFIYGEKELNIVPSTGTSTPDTLTVSSITRSGSLVTVTTSTEHGYTVDDFVTLAGANETDYNGAQRIYSVPSSTTFTFITTATPTTPATGTITCVKRDIVYNFYKLPARITALTDTLLIPDLFFEAFVSYVKARIDLRDSERGSASDGFDEFNELIEDLTVENNKRMLSNVNLLSY
jgi:hypothetical protein